VYICFLQRFSFVAFWFLCTRYVVLFVVGCGCLFNGLGTVKLIKYVEFSYCFVVVINE